MLPVDRPLARASLRLRAGRPVPGRLARATPDTTGRSYYERHRESILARQRADYWTDPTRHRAAVRASRAKRELRIFRAGVSLGLGQ